MPKQNLSTLCYVQGLNTDGCLGFQKPGLYLTPTCLDTNDIKGNIIKFSCGSQHSAFLTDSGYLYTMGNNKQGQLGNGNQTTDLIFKPQLISGVEGKIVDVACGEWHTLVRTEPDGKLQSCGFGGDFLNYGALGHSKNLVKGHLSKFKKVDFDERVIQISAGSSHNIVLTESKQVYAFGNGKHGRLGITPGIFRSSSSETPTQVEFFRNMRVKSVVACGAFSAAITDDNQLYMQGRNDYNQLGTGGLALDIHNAENIPNLVLSKDGNDFIAEQIACSARHSIAVNKIGEVFCQGDRLYTNPIKVDSFPSTKIKSLAAGLNTSLCLTDDGELYTQGNRNSQLLGRQMTGQDFNIPLKIPDLEHIQSISCGSNHAAAIVSSS